MTITCESLVGYTGGRVACLNDKELVYCLANNIMRLDVSTGVSRYASEGTVPLGCVAINQQQSMMVVGVKGETTSVLVYSLPDMGCTQTIPNLGNTDCSEISFSRDGLSLAVLGSLPTFTITIFSINRSTQFLTIICKTNASQQPRHLSFSPFSKNDLVSTGYGHVVFWRVEKIQGTPTLTSVEGKLQHQTKITCCCFSTLNGEVLCGTSSGDILEFNTSVGTSKPWWDSPGGSSSALAALSFSRHHVVATSSDGIMRFFRHDSHTIERSITLSTVKVAHVVNSTNWNTFYVCGSDGVLQSVVLPGYEKMQLRADQFREIGDIGTPLMDCSGGGYRGVCHLQAGTVVITIGEDSTLRSWDYTKNSLLSKTHCGKGPCCIVGGNVGSSHIVAVGYETSHLRLFDLSDFKRPKLISQEKLCEEGKVSLVSVSPTGKCIAAAVEGHGLFFSDSVHQIHILGCLPVDSQIKDITWIDPSSLLIATDNGDLREIEVPVSTAPSGNHEFPKSLVTRFWRLDLPVEKMFLTQSSSDGVTVACCSRDKGVKLYTLDRAAKQTDNTKMPVKKPQVQWKPNDKLGVAITVVDNIVYSASQDGRLDARDLKAKSGDKPLASVNKHDCLFGGVAGMCLSHNKKRIITVGTEGLLGVFSISDGILPEMPFHIVDQTGTATEIEDESVVYMVKAEEEKKRLVDAKYKMHRQTIIDQIGKLREQLQHYKNENKEAKPEEKLETQAFMIESQRQAIQEEGKKLMEEKEEEIKWTNLANDFIADNIKKQCWDSMQTPLMVLKGIGKSEVQVPNYNILKVTNKEKSLLRKLKFMREVEKLEWSRRKGFESLDDLVAPDAERETVPPPDEERAEGEGTTEEMTLDEEALLPVGDHLYNKYITYTRSRTVTQMTLLQQEIFVQRFEFNKLVGQAQAKKKTEMAKIAEKNVRIKQILKELEQPDTVLNPEEAPSEHPQRVLIVDDSEIDISNTLSSEKQAEEGEGNKKKDSEEHEGNEKALKIMMDNRLERDERVVVEIKMPSFADPNGKDYKPQDDWTDEEMKLWREYEKKLQKRGEEEEKHKRALQQEHRELQKEVDTIVAGYDDTLAKLFDIKLDTDTCICQMDLQIIKLAQSRVQQEEMGQHYQKLAKIVESVKSGTNKAVQLANEAQRELQTKRDKFEELVANEKKKSGEKEIRTQPPFLECEEYCDVLIKQLKKSIKPKKDKQKKDKDEKKKREDAANPDPFAFIEEEEEEKKKKVTQQPEIVEVKLDKPEGLREDLWREFLEFRRERLEAEREQKLLSDELQEMTKVTDRLTRESKLQQQNFEEKQLLLSDFKQQMVRESYNLDILHTFKQGKIEVEQEAVVTDYADGILIHKNNIEELNVQIREHGKAKVDKMREIMQFKKGIRYIEWENQMLKHEVRFCEMEYKHLHTLRVTKAMQEFIKGGGENHHDLERSGIMKKIEHLRSAMQSKIEEKKQAMQKIKRIIKEKDSENQLLEEQVKEAKQLVGQREEIYHLQSTGLDHQRNLKLMKDMRVTRKLEDVAKAQQEEMKLLKKEIDRLRERTFPSFAVVSKRVVGNPDELP